MDPITTGMLFGTSNSLLSDFITAKMNSLNPKTNITQQNKPGKTKNSDWDKLKAIINPKNWGVKDYTDRGGFNNAYASAKKAGEKEFMYNNKRFNTTYAGTPRQEVGAYGVNGKPVHPMDLNNPAQVNLYPALGKYLPGHISASILDNTRSVDYSSIGNQYSGIDSAKNRGEKTFNVYGQDNLTFSNKAASLPTGYYDLADKYTPSDWNLFTNNCADNVCDAFGIPRNKYIETPSNALSKIKKKYPTLDVTDRTYQDYLSLARKVLNDTKFNEPDNILKQSKNLVGIISSPDLKNTDAAKYITQALQLSLQRKGYDLLKSKGSYDGPRGAYDGEVFDGILGSETKQALLDYQTKNKKRTL